MMNWIRRHPYLTLFGAMGFLFLFVGIEFLSMVEDIKIMWNDKPMAAAQTKRGASRPPNYSLRLLSGFSIPAKLTDAAKSKIGKAWDPETSLIPSPNSAAGLYAAIASESALAEKIAVHLMAQAASLPVCASLPTAIDIGASTANYREIAHNARLLVFFARAMALEGKRQHAWALACGPILLGYHLEAEETACAGLPAMTRMISLALREIGSRALYELAPSLGIDRPLAFNTFNLLERVEAGLYPIMECFEHEARFAANVPILLAHLLETGKIRKKLTTRPSLAMRSLSNSQRFQKQIDPMYNPLRALNGKPWKDVAQPATEVSRIFDELRTQTFVPSVSWFKYLVRPSEYIVDSTIAVVIPNFYRTIKKDYVCRQTTRGVGIAYVIAAYQNEFGHWPKTLSEAESWMKVRFPTDLMTGDAIKYEITAFGTPSLVSPGPDLAFGTSDDLTFLPFPEPVSNIDESKMAPHDPQ